MNTLNIPLLYRRSKDFLHYHHLLLNLMNTRWLELLMSQMNFHGPEDDRAIEVFLYIFFLIIPRDSKRTSNQPRAIGFIGSLQCTIFHMTILGQN